MINYKFRMNIMQQTPIGKSVFIMRDRRTRSFSRTRSFASGCTHIWWLHELLNFFNAHFSETEQFWYGDSIRLSHFFYLHVITVDCWLLLFLFNSIWPYNFWVVVGIFRYDQDVVREREWKRAESLFILSFRTVCLSILRSSAYKHTLQRALLLLIWFMRLENCRKS